MVVDGRVGFAGGINLSRTYENPPSAGFPADGDTQHAYWRDTAVEIQGPAVAELQRLFFDTWKQQNGDPVPAANYFPPLPRQGVQTVRIIGSAPGDRAAALLYLARGGDPRGRRSASGYPPAISCRRTRSARIWQRRRDVASI